jgi:hypothetical protein
MKEIRISPSPPDYQVRTEVKKGIEHMTQKEARSRIKINKLLEESGWRFFDDERGPANIQLEPGVVFDNLGDDLENAETHDKRKGVRMDNVNISCNYTSGTKVLTCIK